jgi:hypothetical protein
MNKALIALVGAGALALTAMAAPQDAYARPRGGAVAAGVIGGLAAGAIIGGAIAASPGPAPYPAYAPVGGYEPYPAYYGAVPVGCPGGYWARRPLHDPYGRVVGWSRPRFFCPAY